MKIYLDQRCRAMVDPVLVLNEVAWLSRARHLFKELPISLQGAFVLAPNVATIPGYRNWQVTSGGSVTWEQSTPRYYVQLAGLGELQAFIDLHFGGDVKISSKGGDVTLSLEPEAV